MMIYVMVECMPHLLMFSLFFMQMGQQNFCCYTRWRYFLLGGISCFCSALFQWFWWAWTHFESEQKNFRVLWKGSSWSKTIFATLHYTGSMEGALWFSVADFPAKKISLWPFGYTCPRPTNFSKINSLLMT